MVPRTDWNTLKMIFTATHTQHLRIHLRYVPGQGTIYVRDVKVFELRE